MAEERQLDLFTVKLGGLRVKGDLTQLITIAPAPTTMRPWPHDQQVGDAGILPLRPTIRLQRTKQILGVKPSANGQHRTADILEMRPDVARLPVSVVRRMRKKLFPFRYAT